MALSYRRIFKADGPLAKNATMYTTAGDRRDGRVYVYTDEIELAINVAIASARPLLVRGPSGSGKSSLAQNVALKLGWRYYEHVVSSVTEARDLLWRFDSVRQLADATAGTGREFSPNRYLQPGPLWWAFDPQSARLRGLSTESDDVLPAEDPATGVRRSRRAVLLIDEIDKADPDVPNNLLVPLGSLQFRISYPERTIKADPDNLPFVMITTNEERELPAAFVRRCVVTTFDWPDRNKLLRIASEHFGASNNVLYEHLADRLGEVRAKKEAAGEIAPSTAEYLDAVAACISLAGKTGGRTAAWKEISRIVLEKPPL
jgi:MoxR-like ATPase